jgi:hypothetical protein
MMPEGPEENEVKRSVRLNKQERMFVAFVLNLLPGLGFYFSGTAHNLKPLRFLGVGLIATILILLPMAAVATHPQPLIDYHFTASEMLIPLVIALVFGGMGAGVEYKMDNGDGVKP